MQRPFLIFAVAFVALMAGALFYAARLPVSQPAATPQGAQSPSAPKPAADPGGSRVSFTLADLQGSPRNFAEWDGSHRLLNFWATWCAPCRREIPLLKAFQEQHSAADLQVIGIAVDFIEPVIEYAEAAQFNYPILVGEQDAMAVAESSGVQFVGLPFTMVVARDGELVGTHMGEIHQQHLDTIAKLLARLDRGEIDKDAVREAINGL